MREALKLALEALSPWMDTDADHTEQHAAYYAIKQALAAQPAPVQEPVAWMYPDDYERMLTSETFCTVYSVEVGSATRGESSVALYTNPPAAAVLEGRDWSLLEATQESLREHMAEIKRLKEAQPAVPDAMTSADIQEHIEYVAGWNECRQAMLKGMK